jgi:signal peptidase II
MKQESKIPLMQSGIRWLWISALVFVADQISKIWIRKNLALKVENMDLAPWLNIHHTFNPGAAWSFCADCGGAQRWVFSVLGIVVSIVLVVWLRRLVPGMHKMLIVGLTLIVGGAIGNVTDRLYLGHVIDFIQVHWQGWYFPSFNVADSAISIGAGLVILDSLREMVRERREKRGAAKMAKAAGK